MGRRFFLGLVGPVLGLACVEPELVTADGLEFFPGEVAVLLDVSGDGRRVRRLEQGSGLSWATSTKSPPRLELWVYGCADRLPEGFDWAPPPACIPPPKRRHRYDPASQRWQQLDEAVEPLVEVCSNCELSRLHQVGFEFPRRPTPYLLAAASIAPTQLLAVVGGVDVLPAYYWINEAQGRALTLEGL